jgi:peroxiredoxin
MCAVPALVIAVTASASLPQFALRDTSGAVHRPDEWASKRAIVVFFTTVECPLSNGYVPEMNRIVKAYAGKGVTFYAVEADTTVTEADVRKHALDFQFSFPMLMDPKQTLVQMAGATATPEVAVFSSAGKVLYLGRIDNRVEDFDKRRTVITEHDLTDALDAVLAGKAAPHPKTRAIGCIINYLTEAKKP